MTQLTAEKADAVRAACEQNLSQLTDLFNQCFDVKHELQLGTVGVWLPTEIPAKFMTGGLATTFDFGDFGAACLFPDELLPAWYRTPDEAQYSRLQGLAWEWSRLAFPAELESARAAALSAPSLMEVIHHSNPAAHARTLELMVEQNGVPRGSILLVWPLESPRCESQQPQPPVLETPVASAPNPLARMRHIPVPVSVRLAEKRIPVSQLLGIMPGALITFNKSCEDLLDLYVNNALFCRGEAVKVGENFGLKINQIGVPPEEPSRLVLS